MPRWNSGKRRESRPAPNDARTKRRMARSRKDRRPRASSGRSGRSAGTGLTRGVTEHDVEIARRRQMSGCRLREMLGDPLAVSTFAQSQEQGEMGLAVAFWIERRLELQPQHGALLCARGLEHGQKLWRRRVGTKDDLRLPLDPFGQTVDVADERQSDALNQARGLVSGQHELG